MKKKMDGFEIVAVLFVACIGFVLQYHFIMEHPDAPYVGLMSPVFPLMLSWVVARTVLENRKYNRKNISKIVEAMTI